MRTLVLAQHILGLGQEMFHNIFGNRCKIVKNLWTTSEEEGKENEGARGGGGGRQVCRLMYLGRL